MAPLPMTLKVTFAVCNVSNSHARETARIYQHSASCGPAAVVEILVIGSLEEPILEILYGQKWSSCVWQ